ncbi:FAD-binding oxidoreductase [Brevibacillus fluminis]|uniref:FAD-binding oxidoreductase n=1 Tax=Brevibacillus fluminis TaxID=511487 RepID=UPI003F89885C
MNLVEELAKLLTPGQVTANQTMREQHGRDESYHAMKLPDAVVFPESAVDVQKVLTFANEHDIAVVPFGLGTSLEGHVIPEKGGISLDFQRMNRILEIRPADFLVRVEPGVTRSQLNKELKQHGLFFTVDPGADATLGGMAATNASGTTAVRYGVMRDQVRDLTVVLPDGRIMKTGGLAAKSSSGYHLTGMFVGSEGTLGAITELTLRVYGIPEHVMAARVTFGSVKDAVDTAYDILAANVPIARVELVDAESIERMNRHSQTSYEEAPTLFLEFHGNEAGLNADIAFVQELAEGHDCKSFQFETDSKARAQLWEARHQLAYAFKHASPGKHMILTDVCVPLSELTDAVLHARSQMDRLELFGGVLGHIGDGNFHTIIMIDTNDPDEVARAEAFNALTVEHALERGGTCTGEHGVGKGKVKYQRKEHGASYDLMHQIKQLLDPRGIMNPGTIFPVE